MPTRKRSIPAPDFGKALRYLRNARNLSQDDLGGLVSGRSYVGELERGLKQPTLTTAHELSRHLQVHPLTLLALAYSRACSPAEVEQLALRVMSDMDALATDRE